MLQLMVTRHMEALEQLNTQLVVDDAASVASLPLPARQLLEIAQRSADDKSSSIARYNDELGLYVVDPSVDGRIVCLQK